MKIEFPFHGAVVNHRFGRQKDRELLIPVTGQGHLMDRITVNGIPAQRSGAQFSAEVSLKEETNNIVVVSEGSSGRKEHRIKVIWDRFSRPRYRFFIDDNIFFLRDITQHRYASLFESFYLKNLKELHRKYGVKFVLNIFYNDGDQFNLSLFPDRYQSEWRDNADWLKLSFHGYGEYPDRPYQYASPEKLTEDFDRVSEEIIRFAGEATYAPTTVIHWAMVNPEALPALVPKGVKVLSGFFTRWPAGFVDIFDINYLLGDERSEYLSRHEALKDFGTDIIFSRTDIICNSTALDRIESVLETAAENPFQSEVMDIGTHEQYFWPFYGNYLPDHWQRIETAIRWVTEHGYQPVFLHKGYLLRGEE